MQRLHCGLWRGQEAWEAHPLLATGEPFWEERSVSKSNSGSSTCSICAGGSGGSRGLGRCAQLGASGEPAIKAGAAPVGCAVLGAADPKVDSVL